MRSAKGRGPIPSFDRVLQMQGASRVFQSYQVREVYPLGLRTDKPIVSESPLL